MENKKLLKYLLNDLTEIDSILNEHKGNYFDEMEMEFFRNRVKGARKLIQMFIDQEVPEPVSVQKSSEKQIVQEPDKMGSIINAFAPEIEISMTKPTQEPVTKENVITDMLPKPTFEQIVEAVKPKEIVIPDPVVPVQNIEKELKKTIVKETDTELNMPMDQDSKEHVFGKLASAIGNTVEAIAADEDKSEVLKPAVEKTIQASVQKELTLDDEIPNEHNKRLGDSFTKEKSVNDLRSDDVSKLEHKLSNMPLTNLQAAIGINDRFQYVRELFDGKPELYAKTVNDLDEMNNLKDAVSYLQNNFKWKKTDTSLKFVSLIKRRFPNE